MSAPSSNSSVVIVGGGWSGLACAYKLCCAGHKVTLLESAKQLGGRARRVPFQNKSVDNGQHLLIGAYRQTLRLINTLNKDADDKIYRTSLNLDYLDSDTKHYALKTAKLFPPLNMLSGLLAMRGMNIKDKWRALRFGMKLFAHALILDKDISVKQLLINNRQTQRNIRVLWEPLCLAALNTHIDSASAKIFINVLTDTFCQNRNDSDLIVPRCDLSEILPDRIYDFVEQHDATIKLNQRAQEIIIDQSGAISVKTETQAFHADHIVLAISPNHAHTLIKSHPALDDIAYNLSGFTYNPICTLYLQYPEDVRLRNPIQGLLGSTSQWLIDRQLTGQPGLIAVTISGKGEHMQWDNEHLTQHIIQEIKQHFPFWPEPQHTMVIREKRATFDCCVGIDMIRPDNRTPLKGLWLAGDYTRSPYPATIEAAVRSGQKCAQLITRAE